MATFVLVHGAWHGAWCWDRVRPRLTAAGHEVRTVDLPGTSDDPQAAARATMRDCVEAVGRALPQDGARAWLVGHSMGGAVAAAAAEAFPERLAGVVYVTATLPVDGQTGADAVGRTDRGELDTATAIDPERGVMRLQKDLAGPVFYPLCAPQDVALARDRLAEWQGLAPLVTPVRRSSQGAGRAPTFYVECLRDRVLPIAYQRAMHTRAGVRATCTLDTDHSPFFSRAAELAAALETFAAQG